MIRGSKIPKKVQILKLPKRVKVNTTNGQAKITECIVLHPGS